MKCPLCGNVVSDNDRYCSNCGENNEFYIKPRNVEPANVAPQSNTQQSNISDSTYNSNQYLPPYLSPGESSTYGILSIVFGALGGWLGLVFGIIGLNTYKRPENRRKCVIGICLWGVWVVLLIIVGLS